jgi:hypothetical protein
MLHAKTPAGERLAPVPGGRALCGQCGGEVLAKCGRLVSWHWAHRAADCDSWAEGETEWHLGWKRSVCEAACEVVVGDHRADIRTLDGLVVELQHSPIDGALIAERETFYGSMVWLFDAQNFELALYPSAAELTFVWRRPRRSLLAVAKPMYWDLGHGFVLFVKALSSGSPLGGFGGSGVLLDAACWASQLFGGSARPGLHAAAVARTPRVASCLAHARALLQQTPSLGLDGAVANAMRELAAGTAAWADER